MAPESPASVRAGRPQVVGVPAGEWLTLSNGRLRPGRPSKPIAIPTKDAQQLLQAATRLVADLPRTGSRDVVWVSGTDELRVATDQVTLACHDGLVVVTVPVSCDQLAGRPGTVDVPFAVGTREAPRGLMMSTLVTPTGPAVVTAVWADSLIAFAWESLLTLVREVARASGVGQDGRHLVPLSVAATDDGLIVQAMAGHAP